MSADYAPAQEHFVPRNFMFDSNAGRAIVIHKTAGDATPAAIYNTFLASGNPGNSTHYGVGQDGGVWQYVPEALGAGGNGAVEVGYDPFWDQYLAAYGNLNLCTFSIEHCDPASDNSTPLTPAQQDASFRLVAHLVQTYHIPLDHIKTHASIDPINRARCPGNYPMAALLAYLRQPTVATPGPVPTTPAQGGTVPTMQLYTPSSADFSHWFEVIDASHYRCRANGAILQGFNLATYCQLSLDGQTLPVIGLPTRNETTITVKDKAGAPHTLMVALCERGALCYDPAHVKDSQPGMTASYLLHLSDPDLLALVDPTPVVSVGAQPYIDAIHQIQQTVKPLT